MSEYADEVLRSLTLGDELKFRRKKLVVVAEYLQQKLDAGLLHPSCQKQITVQALGALLTQLITFLEEAFGRYSTAADGREFTKWPSSVLRDFSAGGAVCCMLETCFQEKLSFGWASVDFEQARGSSLQIERQYSHLLRTITNMLLSRGFLTWPRVHLAAGLVSVLTPEQVQALEHIVTSHRGSIVSTWEKATHVIEPDSAAITKRRGAPLYARAVTIDDAGRTQLHWWYYPDSCDQWLTSSEIVGELKKQMEAPSGPLPWRLGERWLHDTELFNEWMNEVDYMVEAEPDWTSQRQPVTLSAQGGKLTSVRVESGEEVPVGPSVLSDRKTKSATEDFRKAKKPRTTDSLQINDLGLSLEFPPRPAEVNTVETEDGDPPYAAAFANLSKPPELDPQTSFPYAGAVRVERASKWKAPFPVLLPASATWFDLDSIHENESRALPEFTAKSAKKAYKDIRDFLVCHYRMDPRVYLSASKATELVHGDASAVFRVHTFLEQWGIINYGITPDCDPLGASIVNTASLYPIYSHDTDCGLSHTRHEHEQVDPLISLLDITPTSRSQLLLRKSGVFGWPFVDDSLAAHGRLAAGNQFRCVTCDKRCEILRYVCRQRKDFSLCTKCFANGTYPEILTDKDFVRVSEDAEQASADLPSWTNEELKKLLEGLSKYEENWDQVAAHVGTKSKDQCVLAFVQMPVEEPFSGQVHSFLGVTEKPSQPPFLIATSQPSLSSSLSSELSSSSTSSSSSSSSASYSSLQPSSDSFSSSPFSNSSSSPSSSSSSSSEIVFNSLLLPGSKDNHAVPFASHSNPVMALVGWLAAHVSPSVASAAAQACLNSLAIQAEQAENAAYTVNGNSEMKAKGSSRPAARLPLNPSHVKRAAEQALEAAAAKAWELAQEEERKAIRCTSELVKAQLKKIELKMDMLEGMEQNVVEINNKLEFSYQQMLTQKQLLMSRLVPMSHGRVESPWLHSG